jgi:hypothetical protein
MQAQADRRLDGAVRCAGRAVGPCADQFSHAGIDPATVFEDVPVENVLPGRTAARCPVRSRCRLACPSTQRPFTPWRAARLTHLYTMIGEDAQLDIRHFRPNIFVDTAPGGDGFLAGCGKTRFMHKMPLGAGSVGSAPLRSTSQSHCRDRTGWRSCRARQVVSLQSIKRYEWPTQRRTSAPT